MLREQVNSSNIMSIGYEESEQTLEVEFANGSVYQYFGVPSGTHLDLMSALSVGSFFAQNIKNSFAYQRVE